MKPEPQTLLILLWLTLGLAACREGGRGETPAPTRILDNANGQTMKKEPGVQELLVVAGDVTLHATVVGAPETGVVLIGIHGGPGMSSDYMASLELLAGADLAVVTYDQRGTGRSNNPDPDAANYDLLKYVADLEAIREALGAESVHLFGHSWGGLVAQRYATVHPDRVNSIVLMGSGAPTIEATLAANDNKTQRLADLKAQGFIPDTLILQPHIELVQREMMCDNGLKMT